MRPEVERNTITIRSPNFVHGDSELKADLKSVKLQSTVNEILVTYADVPLRRQYNICFISILKNLQVNIYVSNSKTQGSMPLHTREMINNRYSNITTLFSF